VKPQNSQRKLHRNAPKNSLILTVSRKLLGKWELKDGAKVPFTCGSLHGDARVHVAESGAGTSLRWPGGRLDWQPGRLPGHVTYSEEEGVQVRPLVGIMTTGVRDDEQRPVGVRTALLGDFVRAARDMNVLCFLFNASDVAAERQMVRGVTLVGSKGRETWKFYQFPLPDVVYNRVPSRKAENFPAVRSCKELFAAKGIPMFNERFLSKREMYQWLEADPRTSDLVPATERLRNPERLRAFCRRHDLVFLKPTGGSLGMGIFKVKRHGENYSVRFRRKSTHVSQSFGQPVSLFHFVKAYNSRSVYMMQQGIHLRSYQGNATDFRVHLHKNAVGRWESAGIGAKVAGRGAVTTHVHNGGRVLSGDKVLAEWYGTDAERMLERMVDASVRVAEAFEAKMHHPVGELGLDVGVDDLDRIWVFEGNAKPGRAIFRHPDLKEAGRRSARLVIEFATYLNDFALRGGGT
jgi:hypothetical protein